MPPTAANVVYELGPFRLDPEAGALTHAGLPTALGARGVAVLTALVRVPNEYVRKDAILEAAWPGVIVEDNNLAAQISAIRRALARAPGGEQWIETLTRRGYRFVGPVTAIGGALPPGENRGAISNLPETLTTFIGRERELVETKRLLSRARLLTIVGIGGIGKTRLAMQMAAEVLSAYRDGVWFVDLGPLTDSALVPSAVAQVLRVREVAGTPVIETLCDEVKGRQALLLLDNCEHLLASCARLADTLLRIAPNLIIVATSREPLQVTGEQILLLPALSLPEAAASAEGLAQSDAVQLFIDRAQRQQPDFVVTESRVSVVAQLCIRLDGIPLALELAAARIRSLTVEQVNARLDDRFRLLTGGSRTAVPRQQTLRATLNWSYDLLGEPERATLRRLAVFVGGFTLEAGSSVASDETIDEYAVVDLISQLVARSLVVANTNGARTRYRLLETTRAYALELLAESGETTAIQRRHARYFRDAFERAPDDWMRMADAEWNAKYVPDLDNIRAGLDWAFAAGGDPALGVELAGVSAAMWVELSLDQEGTRRLGNALELLVPDTPALDQARLWTGLGMLWEAGMAVERASAGFQKAADFYRPLDNALGLGYSLVRQGRMLAHMARLEETASAFDEALPMLERAGTPAAWGIYFNGLGLLNVHLGEPAVARAHYERALVWYENAGAHANALGMLNNLVDLTWALGDLDAALAVSVDANARLRNSQNARKITVGCSLINLAGIHVERGELAEALKAAQEGLPLLKESGLVWYPLDHLALRVALVGKCETAALLAGYADAAYMAREVSREPNEIRARARLQRLLQEHLRSGDVDRLLKSGANLGDDEACRLALEA